MPKPTLLFLLVIVSCSRLWAQEKSHPEDAFPWVEFRQRPFSIQKPERIRHQVWHSAWIKGIHRKFILQNKTQDPPTGPTICAPVKELDHAYLCISARQEDQNRLFSRMSIFSEGTKALAPGTWVELSNPWYQYYSYMVGGHDLRQSVLQDFFSHSQASKRPLSPREDAFYREVFLPLEKKYFDPSPQAENIKDFGSMQAYSIITASVQSHLDFEVVVTHEFLHAQFYLDSQLQKLLLEYWKRKLTEKERADITLALSKAGYHKEDLYVVIKEFYAYLFQKDAQHSRMKPWVNTHQKKIRRRLKKAGIPAYTF
ncbi:MAG: hypothetical protein KDD52_00265 [Bdellovibrionales bacterium]|nr:hypothetical protein [Bdellovibrionales bacterium]